MGTTTSQPFGVPSPGPTVKKLHSGPGWVGPVPGAGLPAPPGQGRPRPLLPRWRCSDSAELSSLSAGAGRLSRSAPPARLRSWSPALSSRLPAPPRPAPPRPVHCSPRARAGRAAARRGSERRGGAGSRGTRGGDRRPRTAAGGAAVRGCGGSRKPQAAGAVSAPGRPMA